LVYSEAQPQLALKTNEAGVTPRFFFDGLLDGFFDVFAGPREVQLLAGGRSTPNPHTRADGRRDVRGITALKEAMSNSYENAVFV
jgi:hypothetical protein